MISSLEIKNYRLFKDFKLSSLSRVNLIVGTNNGGKSSLLEAIYLLTSDRPRYSLSKILRERGEVATLDSERLGRDYGLQITQIFHNRNPKDAINIASNATDKSLTISVEGTTSAGRGQPSPLGEHVEDEAELEHEAVNGAEVLRLTLRSNSATIDEDVIKLYGDLIGDRSGVYPSLSYKKSGGEGTKFVTTSYAGYKDLAPLWDNIMLASKEGAVIEALRIINSEVNDINFMTRSTSNSGILVKMRQEKERLPLGSMGDGMKRILSIAMNMVSVPGGTLLIDEIDTGLYYSVLSDMWRLVIETAVREDIQVFATTHSWDCVRAFQEALCQQEDKSLGQLIRIDREDGEIRPESFSADELAVAVEQGIEIR